jgi:Ca2+-binding RTX toxin-like protein
LNGRGGEDYLEGNAGKDILVGGAANDILMGGNNRDELMGGIGKDFLQGGAGRDRFIYSSGKEGRDTIADFQTGKDLIDLRAIFSKRNFDRPNSFEAYVRLSQTSQGTVVKVDSNGDLAGGFTALAVLSEVNVGDINRSSFRV